MRYSKKIVIIIIIILLLLLCLLAIIMMDNNKDSNQNQEFVETPFDMYDAYQKQREKDGVTADDAKAYLENNASEYYTVEGIIKTFDRYVTYLNCTAKDLNLIVTENNEDELLAKYKVKGYEYISNVLASEYKKEYSVDNEYLFNQLSDNAGKSYTIVDMYAVDDSDMINTYYVFGKYEDNEYNYIVILDKYNYTFEIYLSNYLEDNKIEKSDSLKMKTRHVSTVEKNEFNSFTYKNIEEEQMVRSYYDQYNEFMKKNPEQAYNMLNSEYREKRFESIDEFKKYVSTRTKNDCVLSTYSINEDGDYTEITCKDNLDGNITFRVSSVMKYNVILDSYTMNIKLFDKEYKEVQNDAQKAMFCMDRFIECINAKDYKKAYEYLNDEYRSKNFKSEQEFEEYIKENWFENNKYIYDQAKLIGKDVIISGSIIDSTKFESYDAEFYEKSFVIKLGTKYNSFEISFEK